MTRIQYKYLLLKLLKWSVFLVWARNDTYRKNIYLNCVYRVSAFNHSQEAHLIYLSTEIPKYKYN